MGNTAFNFWYKTPGVPFEETYQVHPPPRRRRLCRRWRAVFPAVLRYASVEGRSRNRLRTRGVSFWCSNQSEHTVSERPSKSQRLKDPDCLTASPAVQRTPRFFTTAPQTIRVSWQTEHWPAGPTDLALGHAPDQMVCLHQGVAAQVDSIKTCVEIATGFSA